MNCIETQSQHTQHDNKITSIKRGICTLHKNNTIEKKEFNGKNYECFML